MSTTLVVVAQRAKARLFRHDGPGKGLVEVFDLAHPAARLPNVALDTDRPGHVNVRSGPSRHAMEKEEPSKDHEAARFAREVADEVRAYRTHERIDRIILVAEPRFLGMLRQALDDASARMVEAELHKELTDLPQQEIEDHLGVVLAV